jgi:NitT/TauT family transport system substrate-binding protein
MEEKEMRFRSRRARLCAVMAAAVCVCVVGAQSIAQSASNKNMKLRVGYTLAPVSLIPYVAQDKGFFKENGLDVTLTGKPSFGGEMPAIGKQYDIIFGSTAELLTFTAKGGDPIVVAGSEVLPKELALKTPNTMVPKGINSLKQLKGKTIGTVGVGRSQLWVAMCIALKRAGLNPKKDVKFLEVPFANQVDAVKSGRIDVAIGVPPYLNQMKASGLVPLNNVLASVSTPTLAGFFVGKRSATKKNPKAYAAFRRSYIEALNYLKANPAYSQQTLMKVLNLPASAAKAPYYANVQPTLKNKWITNWIVPMERIGLVKKGKLSKKRSYVFSKNK